MTPLFARVRYSMLVPGGSRMKFVTRAFALVGVVALLVGGLIVSRNLGLLSPLGVESTSKDSQVIQAVERTEEVALVSLSIQGITDEKRNSTVFGRRVPGTGETVFLQYEFSAKLGLDGAAVDIKREGADGYQVSVPDFTFIGFDQPKFEVVVTDGGVLSFVTPDIDTTKVITKILNSDSRNEYVTKNLEVLEEQTRAFYERLITSIDPAAEVEFVFATAS